MGYPVYDSDQRARSMQTHNQELIREMVGLLGDDILESGEINRAKVAAKVFDNEKLLAQLNDLVHPRIKADYESWMLQQKGPLIFKESALLIESGTHKNCNAVIFVAAPEQMRINRVMRRDGVSEEQVRARIKRQMPDAEKQEACTHSVYNDNQQLLIPQVEDIVQSLLRLEKKSD